MNVDLALVRDAASALGTKGTTATVHAAMNDVVRRARRQRLATRDFPDLTPEVLSELRSPRQDRQ